MYFISAAARAKKKRDEDDPIFTSHFPTSFHRNLLQNQQEPVCYYRTVAPSIGRKCHFGDLVTWSSSSSHWFFSRPTELILKSRDYGFTGGHQTFELCPLLLMLKLGVFTSLHKSQIAELTKFGRGDENAASKLQLLFASFRYVLPNGLAFLSLFGYTNNSNGYTTIFHYP